MLSVDLSEVELFEERSELDPRHSLRYAFPLSSAEGTASTAAVYFELGRGKRLSRHTDSAEETLIVLEGIVEATVGKESCTVGSGGMVVIPALAPHAVANAGDGLARVVGVFSSLDRRLDLRCPVDRRRRPGVRHRRTAAAGWPAGASRGLTRRLPARRERRAP